MYVFMICCIFCDTGSQHSIFLFANLECILVPEWYGILLYFWTISFYNTNNICGISVGPYLKWSEKCVKDSLFGQKWLYLMQ